MSKTVDARNLTCPQPVILTRKAMADSAEVLTIVNSATSRDNVRRMAEKAGRTVTVEEQGGEFHLHILGAGVEPAGATAPPAGTAGGSAGPLVLVVSDRQMGRGDQQLGEILVRGFFHTLGEVEPRPDTIIFFNAGVWLPVDGSPVLADLQALEESGVRVLSCGTCLNHYGLTAQLAVGVVSNMYDIAETMLSAGKIVNL